ncbi:MAG: autotransporter outer membrane beta-barrel domain-containing protein, partial [Pirellulales bacterium]
GTIDADTSGQTIYVTGSSVTNTGTVAAEGGGVLSLSNLVSPMAGTLTAGAGGVLTVNGALTIDPTGVVNVDLGGTAATQFGQIDITGAASLGGTLDLTLVNGYQPASGDALKIMTFASESGTFAMLNGSTISANLVWAPMYDEQDLTLVAGSPQLADVNGRAASAAGQPPSPQPSPGGRGSITPSLQYSATGGASNLQPADVVSLKQAAIAGWTAAGLDPRLVALLHSVDISLAHLGNGVLAVAAGGRIILSDDADGLGWFIDPTFSGNFASSANDHVFAALSDNAGASPFDLLTVLQHELGHVLGLPDQPSGDDLMAQTLAPGTRRTPSPADIDALFGNG